MSSVQDPTKLNRAVDSRLHVLSHSSHVQHLTLKLKSQLACCNGKAFVFRAQNCHWINCLIICEAIINIVNKYGSVIKNEGII